MEHLFLFCRSTAAEFVTSNSVLPLSPLDLNPPPSFSRRPRFAPTLLFSLCVVAAAGITLFAFV